MRVVFDYSLWAARYPELAGSVAEPAAQMFFDEATLYCDNTDCSPIGDLTQRRLFLNMLTAHIAALGAAIAGAPVRPLVGRISNASEGSVSVGTEMNFPAGSPQWYNQTQYGASYWAATKQYRLFQYAPGPVFDPDPYAGWV